MTTRYQASLEVGGETGSDPVPVAGLELREEYGAGWEGRAMLALAADTPLGIGEIFAAVLARGIVPGAGVIVRLALTDEERPEEAQGTIVRTWPCVVARINPDPPTPDAGGAQCEVGLQDPIRHLFASPIRGAFAGRSIGEMAGTALALAAGVEAPPSLTPMLPGTGLVTIVEETRESLASIPYAIACGESLGEWLARVTALLGVRSELHGLADGSLEWTFSDRAPGGEPIEMDLVSSESEDEGAEPACLRIHAMHGRAGLPRRGAVLDDIEEPSLWRFDPDLPVGTLIEGAGVGPDEAWRRAALDDERAFVELLTLGIDSRQSAFRPGSLIRIRTLALAGIESWQIGRVAHEVRGRTYANRALALRGDAPWRPRPPARSAPRTVTAIISGEEGMLPNEPVPRDRLGRIPVRIPFPEGAPAGGETSAATRIELPIVQSMAGTLHGFAAAHRNGDACRVTVHHPFNAEIDGFVYREGQELYGGGGLAAGWAGIVVEHDGGEAWSGWAFERAGEDGEDPA